MKQADARVLSTQELYPSVYLQWFSAPGLADGAQVGQFLMLRCRGEDALDPLLPRAMSFHRLRRTASETQFAILYGVIGRGTRWLSLCRPGDRVPVFGPLGRGYRVRPGTRHALLVAGGIGVAPLVWLADELVASGRATTLVVGARTAAGVFPPQLLPPEVEVVVTTEDGSAGRHGLATAAFAELLPWADQVFACGPQAMFAAMAAATRRGGLRKPIQVLAEERMACGTGICYSCALFTRRGVRLVCTDGPMFGLEQLL